MSFFICLLDLGSVFTLGLVGGLLAEVAVPLWSLQTSAELL